MEKLLFLGSSCIYPKLAEQPLKESSIFGGYLEETNKPYAVAKLAGIENYKELLNLPKFLNLQNFKNAEVKKQHKLQELQCFKNIQKLQKNRILAFKSILIFVLYSTSFVQFNLLLIARQIKKGKRKNL